MPRIAKSKSKVQADVCEGENAITVDEAKNILGWEEEDEVKFGTDYDFKDVNNKKIRCSLNKVNRPLRWNQVLTLKQEHLNQRWEFNGETIIIGEKGNLLEGQHTLISLILSSQEIDRHPDEYTQFKKGITCEKIVVTGISEEDKVVNTINTGVTRSLADVIFRSEFFQDLTPRERKQVSRVCDYAVKLLWSRTGAGLNCYSTKRTHSESLDFIDRHSNLLKCVNFIFEENGGGDQKIKKFIPLGSAAGLLYLMSSSNTDPTYYFTKSQSEDNLDLDMFDLACEFWVLLASNDTKFKQLRLTLSKMLEEHGGGNGVKIALLCKAWNLFSNGKAITKAALKLEFEKDDLDNITLAETPTVGGIDRGNPQDPSERDPTPEEIQESAKKIRNGKGSKPKGRRRSSPKHTKAETNSADIFEIGKPVTIKESDDEDTWWRGKVHKIEQNTMLIKVATGFAGAGTIVKVAKSHVYK